jgi:ribosomal protein L16 Arg81 hydroxylase
MVTNFSNLFGITPEEFFRSVWEKNGYLGNSGLEVWNDELLNKEVPYWTDDIIRELIDHDTVLVRDSRRVLPHIYRDKNGRADPHKIRQLWDLGFTIYINHFDKKQKIPALIKETLEAELYPLKIGINFFATPANSTGLKAHFDAHDNFVIQTLGEKKWDMWKAVKQNVRQAMEPEDHAHEVLGCVQSRNPDYSFTLKEGNCLYLPRGLIHAPKSLGVSHHLTVWFLSPLLDEIPRHRMFTDFRRQCEKLYHI